MVPGIFIVTNQIIWKGTIMSKNEAILGISVNHGKVALTLFKAGQIVKTFWEEVPENIVYGSKILSKNLLAEFLKEKLSSNGIKVKKAAYVIADEDLFIKNISMPEMTDEQLRYNIPFEFNDYIHGEMKDYIFDFVKREGEDGKTPSQIRLLAYAVPVETLAGIDDMLSLAGLKLEKAIPETCAYEALLTSVKNEDDPKAGKCFLDIGRRSIRMMIFKNGEYSLSHQIDVGEDHAIGVIADEMGIDMHLAETYLRSNHNECNKRTPVINAFKDISLEVLKGLNYYEMSDMTSRLGNVVLCGTGATTEPLVEILKERIDKNVVTMDEFLSQYGNDSKINVTYTSVGILLADVTGITLDGSMAGKGKKKKANLAVIIPAIVAALALLAVVGKFVIFDQFMLLNKEIVKTSILYEQIDEQTRIVNSYGELAKEYAHYNWDLMTDEEKTRISRTSTAQLVDYIESQGIQVVNLSLTGSAMILNVRASSLQSVSKLIDQIKEEAIVESSSVISASTNEKEEAIKASDTSTESDENINKNDEKTDNYIKEMGVDAQITIYLADKEEGEKTE